jgi:hypothetical protein
MIFSLAGDHGHNHFLPKRQTRDSTLVRLVQPYHLHFTFSHPFQYDQTRDKSPSPSYHPQPITACANAAGRCTALRKLSHLELGRGDANEAT